MREGTFYYFLFTTFYSSLYQYCVNDSRTREYPVYPGGYVSKNYSIANTKGNTSPVYDRRNLSNYRQNQNNRCSRDFQQSEYVQKSPNTRRTDCLVKQILQTPERVQQEDNNHNDVYSKYKEYKRSKSQSSFGDYIRNLKRIPNINSSNFSTFMHLQQNQYPPPAVYDKNRSFIDVKQDYSNRANLNCNDSINSGNYSRSRVNDQKSMCLISTPSFGTIAINKIEIKIPQNKSTIDCESNLKMTPKKKRKMNQQKESFNMVLSPKIIPNAEGWSIVTSPDEKDKLFKIADTKKNSNSDDIQRVK